MAKQASQLRKQRSAVHRLGPWLDLGPLDGLALQAVSVVAAGETIHLPVEISDANAGAFQIRSQALPIGRAFALQARQSCHHFLLERCTGVGLGSLQQFGLPVRTITGVWRSRGFGLPQLCLSLDTLRASAPRHRGPGHRRCRIHRHRVAGKRVRRTPWM